MRTLLIILVLSTPGNNAGIVTQEFSSYQSCEQARQWLEFNNFMKIKTICVEHT